MRINHCGQPMRVFDFNSAIVREPARSVVHGLRSDLSAVPDFEGVVREHRAYVAALREVGLAVDVLPALEAFPDSVFVEDPALVFSEDAIVLRPGAAARREEAEAMSAALSSRFERVLTIEHGYADGGDVLVTPRAVLIGLSARTDRIGAEALRERLALLGRGARIVQTPPGVLHFKSASSLLDEETVLATQQLAASGVFNGMAVMIVPDGEEDAANALRVNDVVLAGTCYPRTIEMLQRKGYRVVPLAIDEIRKLDAGLSCMSLRWQAHQQV